MVWSMGFGSGEVKRRASQKNGKRKLDGVGDDVVVAWSSMGLNLNPHPQRRRVRHAKETPVNQRSDRIAEI